MKIEYKITREGTKEIFAGSLEIDEQLIHACKTFEDKVGYVAWEAGSHFKEAARRWLEANEK